MARAALFVGGPYHLRKMKIPNDHDNLRVARMGPIEWVKPTDTESYMEIRELIYQPRTWFGAEVWVLKEMTDQAAFDQLLTSVFQSDRGR